jgi:hypothetical protein
MGPVEHRNLRDAAGPKFLSGFAAGETPWGRGPSLGGPFFEQADVTATVLLRSRQKRFDVFRRERGALRSQSRAGEAGSPVWLPPISCFAPIFIHNRSKAPNGLPLLHHLLAPGLL